MVDGVAEAGFEGAGGELFLLLRLIVYFVVIRA